MSWAYRARRARNLLRARLRRGAVVLLYHRIALSAHDPFELCVSPENFAAHVAVLARLTRPARLAELAPVAGRPAPRSVAVTFDDAYSDVLTDARPVLESHEIPATVFAVSGALGRVFWWDRMIRIPQDRAREFLAANGGRSSAPRAPGTAGVYGLLHRRLSVMEEGERDALIERLGAGAGPAAPPPRSLGGEELCRLRDTGLFEIGGHTRSHPDLSRLEPAALTREIEGGRSDLERILDAPITSFAYPFGTYSHISAVAVRQVQAAGYQRACTAEPGVVRGTEDPLLLPRLWVLDWSGEEFEKRLRTWLR